MIDAALLQKPDGFDALLKLLAEAGCEVRQRGNTLSLRHPDRKGFVRLSSIEGYTEDALRTVLAGEKEHTTCKKRSQTAQRKNTLLIDIEAKLQEGKGVGYERWAKVFNVKQIAQTYNYLGSTACWIMRSWRPELPPRRSGITRSRHRSRRRRDAWRRSSC